MNHKRGKAKQARSGCLMCKPYKFGHGMEHDLNDRGYRQEVAAKDDIDSFKRYWSTWKMNSK